jgi:hypothetical protein
MPTGVGFGCARQASSVGFSGRERFRCVDCGAGLTVRHRRSRENPPPWFLCIPARVCHSQRSGCAPVFLVPHTRAFPVHTYRYYHTLLYSFGDFLPPSLPTYLVRDRLQFGKSSHRPIPILSIYLSIYLHHQQQLPQSLFSSIVYSRKKIIAKGFWFCPTDFHQNWLVSIFLPPLPPSSGFLCVNRQRELCWIVTRNEYIAETLV